MISLTSPVKTWAHAWPAGAKLGGLSLVTLGMFWIPSPWAHLAILIAVLGAYALPGRQFFIAGMKRLLILWPFVTLLSIWHLVTREYSDGAVVVLRMISAVGLANLVTMTTKLSDMMAVIRWLFYPFSRLGLNIAALEIAIALVIRMTPVLLSKSAQLRQAWRARSTKRAGWRLVLPFTLVALDDAEQTADALRARGGINPQK